MKVFLCLLSFAPAAFSQWRTGYFMQGDAAGQTVAAIPWSKYTHVIHYALKPTIDHGTCKWDRRDNQFTEANVGEFVRRAHIAGVKAVIGLSEDSAFRAIKACTTTDMLPSFVSLISDFVKEHHYDGVDIEWGNGIVTPSDEAQYQNLIRSLRGAMPTAFLSVLTETTDRYVSPVADELDQVNVMAYGLDIYSDEKAETHNGKSARVSQEKKAQDNGLGSAIWYRLSRMGIDSSKIGLGVPFYGRVNQGCLEASETIGLTGPDQIAVNGITNHIISYRDLVNSTYWDSGAHIWDDFQQSEYIRYSGGSCQTDAFITYGGPEQMRAAVGQIKVNGLGGIVTYGLPYEYMPNQGGEARYPLSTAIYNAMGPSTAPTLLKAVAPFVPVDRTGNASLVSNASTFNSAPTSSVSEYPESTSVKTFTYYVDSTEGSDTNPGTITRPWKTVAKVNSTKLRPGQSVGFKRNGMWREALKPGQSGSLGNPITYGAYGVGSNPLFNGSDIVTGFTVYSGSCYKTLNVRTDPKQVFVDDARLMKKANTRTMVPGSFYWDSPTLTLYVWTEDSTNPAGHTMETSGGRFAGIDFNGKSYINVDSIDVTKTGQTGYEFGITTGSKWVNVSHATSSWNAQRGFRVGNWVYGKSGGDNIIFTDCVSFDNLSEAFWIGGGINNGCIRCEAYNGGKDAALKGYTTGDIGGILIGSAAVNNFVKDSFVHDIYNGYALMVEHENHTGVTKPIGTVIAGNVIANNVATLWTAIDEQGQNSIYAYNTVYTSASGAGNLITLDSQGGSATGSVNASFYHNTLYLGVMAWGNGVEVNNAIRPLFKNNIVFTSHPGIWNGYIISVAATNVTDLTMDYNDMSDSQYFYAGRYPQSLAEWKTISRQDAHSIAKNPLFANSASYNLTLQSGSPCIGEGIFISGVSITNPPNIGKY
jgi:GH18 family chitinase